MPNFEVLDAKIASALNKSSIILNEEKRSVWRNRNPKKRTVSFAEDRLHTWSMSTSGSQEPTILSEIYTDLFTLVSEMMIFRNSIQSETEFDCLWRKSDLMTSWEDCTNTEYEGLRNSRPYWNCAIWRFIRRKLDLMITDWRQWWNEVSSIIFERSILAAEMDIMKQTPWSRIQGTKQRVERIVGDCWQWKANGQCPTGENCSFHDDINKRAKSTQPNSSPNSIMQQHEKNASKIRSPRRKSPSGRMYHWQCKEYLKGTCTNSFCKMWHPSTSQKMDASLGKSAHMHIVRLMKNLEKSLKIMVTKMKWLCWKLHDSWVAYLKKRSRRSLQRFCGRAQTYGSQSDVFDSLEPWYVMLTFETRIHRLEWFARVILISVTPMLQNLRIGLKKRRNGKNWPKKWKSKEKHKTAFFSCEIHKPNYHNQSRQQQPPHKQTRKHELALWWLNILPGWVIKLVGPGQNPRYTRAHFGGKVVGCSQALQLTPMCPRKRNTTTTW